MIRVTQLTITAVSFTNLLIRTSLAWNTVIAELFRLKH